MLKSTLYQVNTYYILRWVFFKLELWYNKHEHSINSW